MGNLAWFTVPDGIQGGTTCPSPFPQAPFPYFCQAFGMAVMVQHWYTLGLKGVYSWCVPQ